MDSVSETKIMSGFHFKSRMMNAARAQALASVLVPAGNEIDASSVSHQELAFFIFQHSSQVN